MQAMYEYVHEHGRGFGMKLLRYLVLLLLTISSAAALAVYLLTLPLVRRLPCEKRVAVDGVVTIEDAVAACRRTNLSGWKLVAYAQNRVARKFTCSRLNPWDSPARAQTRGRGYCQQQALALKQIFDHLGIPTRVVFATRCVFPPKIVDGIAEPACVSGHVWLRVQLGDDERDVCPGSMENVPGRVHFTVQSNAHTLYPMIRPFTHLGSVIENVRRDRRDQHWRASHVAGP
jgi:hypothetical protein